MYIDIYIKIFLYMKKKIKKSELKEMVRRLINEYLDYSPADYGYDYEDDKFYSDYDLMGDDEYDRLLQSEREEDAWDDDEFVDDLTKSRIDFEDNALDESIKRLVHKYINKRLK